MPNSLRNVSSRRAGKSRIESQQKLTVNVNPLLARHPRSNGLISVVGQRQKANLLSLQAKTRGIPELRPRLPLSTTEFLSVGLNYHNLETDGFSYQAVNGPIFHNCISPVSPRDCNIQISSQGLLEWPGSNDALLAPVPAGISSSMFDSGPPGFFPTLPPSIDTGELRNITANSTPNAAESLQATWYDTVPFTFPNFTSRETITCTSDQNSFQEDGMQPRIAKEDLFPNSTHEENVRPTIQQETTTAYRCQLLELGSMASIQSDPLLDQSVTDVTLLVPACPSIGGFLRKLHPIMARVSFHSIALHCHISQPQYRSYPVI